MNADVFDRGRLTRKKSDVAGLIDWVALAARPRLLPGLGTRAGRIARRGAPCSGAIGARIANGRLLWGPPPPLPAALAGVRR